MKKISSYFKTAYSVSGAIRTNTSCSAVVLLDSLLCNLLALSFTHTYSHTLQLQRLFLSTSLIVSKLLKLLWIITTNNYMKNHLLIYFCNELSSQRPKSDLRIVWDILIFAIQVSKVLETQGIRRLFSPFPSVKFNYFFMSHLSQDKSLQQSLCWCCCYKTNFRLHLVFICWAISFVFITIHFREIQF